MSTATIVKPHSYNPVEGLDVCTDCGEDKGNALHPEDVERFAVGPLLKGLYATATVAELDTFIDENGLSNIGPKHDPRFMTQTVQDTFIGAVNTHRERLAGFSADAHRRQAHEVDLRDRLVKLLVVHDVEFQRDVVVKAGTAELVTASTVYEVACSPAPKDARKLAANLAVICKQVNKARTGVLLVCCASTSKDIEEIREQALKVGVQAFTLPELKEEMARFGDSSEETHPPLTREEKLENELPENLTLAQPPAKPAAAIAPTPKPPPPDLNLISEILITKIHIDFSIQSRVDGVDQLVVDEYAEGYKRGDKFPPVRLFYDGGTYWLSRGFHRTPAADKAGLEIINCEVLSGGRREALLDSIASNALHGKSRSNADKRHAVSLMLRDNDWVKMSDRAIAEHIRVTQPFVSGIRRTLVTENVISDTKERTTKSGQTMDTTKIGSTKAASLPAQDDLVDEAEQGGMSPVITGATLREAAEGALGPTRTSGGLEPETVEIASGAPAARQAEQASKEDIFISQAKDTAWDKATIILTIKLLPNDGHIEGRKVLIVAHEDGGTPLTRIGRWENQMLNMPPAVFETLNTLELRLDELKLKSGYLTTKGEEASQRKIASRGTAAIKKPAKKRPAAAKKKPAAKSSSKKGK